MNGSRGLTSSIPTLQFLGTAWGNSDTDIGLVCRAFHVPQDTTEARYSSSAGTWEELIDHQGRDDKLRLWQLNSTADLQAATTSLFPLPENPEVAWTVRFQDTPLDHDSTTLPPKIQIEFGGSAWALLFSKEYGNYLLRYNSSAAAFEAVKELPPLQLVVTGEHAEGLVYLRCLRGKIGVSMDRGNSYAFYSDPDPTATITVSSSTYTVRGTGGVFAFGLWQLICYTGTYTSQTKHTGPNSARLAGSLTFTERKSEPAGSSVALTDLSDLTAETAQWRATLTPASTVAIPFTFYKSPELYAVSAILEAIHAGGAGTWDTPYDSNLAAETWPLQSRVSRPLEADQGAATLLVRIPDDGPYDAPTPFQKVLLRQGHGEVGGGDTLYDAACGYVAAFEVRWDTPGEMLLQLELENPTIRFKRQRWNRYNSVPLGGQTVNQAIVDVFVLAGLNASYYNGHTDGDVTMPAGLPEDPFEWPRRGESFWETIKRLVGYVGLELFYTRDGRFVSLPRNFAQPAVTKTYEGNPSTDLKALIKSGTYRVDFRENVTRVWVEAQDEAGGVQAAFFPDTPAETDPFSPRFRPWVEEETEEIRGRPGLAWLTALAQVLGRDLLPVKEETQITAPLDLELSRRDRAEVTGTYLGTTGEQIILSIDDVQTGDRSMETSETTVTLRRAL
jgi:hypothetical protein